MFSFITSAVGAIGNIIGEPIKEWQKRKTIKATQAFELNKIDHQAKVAKANAVLELSKQGRQMDYDLDKLAMQNMEKSWKDELVLLVFLAPMLMAFFPGTANLALAGFAIIAKMPEWYVAIIIGMVVVIYGLRGLLKSYLQRGASLSQANPIPKQPGNIQRP
ncbi:MAG: hypothetical protein JKY87_00265 [Mariprofundus sp.]|nr:hypothetical protein [Mariprofundus sp.]